MSGDDFHISNVSYTTRQSRVLGSPSAGVPQRVGIAAFDVLCPCGHAWQAKKFGAGAFVQSLSHVLFECPSCGREGREERKTLGE